MPQETSSIFWLAFISPGAIFPLMILFLWIDPSRYKAYLPLYAAGKIIGIFSILVWIAVSRRLTMSGVFGHYLVIDLVFLCGDLFALAAIFLISINIRQLSNKTTLAAIDTPDTEDKQCE